MKKYLLLLLILMTSCINDPKECKMEIKDVCFESDYDNLSTCGYSSFKECMDDFSWFGGTCIETKKEVCK